MMNFTPSNSLHITHLSQVLVIIPYKRSISCIYREAFTISKRN